MLLTTSFAHAALITQTDTLSLNAELLGNSSPGNTQSYSHLLSSFNNFNPLADNLQSATLLLIFSGSSNNMRVDIQGVNQFNAARPDQLVFDTSFATPNDFNLSQFLALGSLGVNVTKTSGGGSSTITLLSSALTLEWFSGASNDDTGGPNPVPAPRAFMLMVAGLLSLTVSRRSRKGKKTVI
jgi:hypothetical protein